MVNPQDALNELLKKYDEIVGPISEAAVYDAIRQLQKNINDSSFHNVALNAESMAFSFLENYQDKRTGWGTYYGPFMVMQDEKGEWFEWPSIKKVTSDILEHWQRRSNDAKHPILRSRYADLVWDFTSEVLGTSPNVAFARLVIDETIKISEHGLCKHDTVAIIKLERALVLSLSINDSTRIASVRDAMIALEKSNHGGQFGFSFDNLVVNKKVKLTQEQEDGIIFALESRLHHSSSNEKNATPNPFDAEEAAMRLAKYYESKGRTEDKHRVLRLYGHAFISASENAAGLVGSAWLQKVFDVFSENGMRRDADALTELISKMNKKVTDEMHEISAEVSIPKEEIDKYIAEMTKGTLEEKLTRIAWHFVPDLNENKKNIQEQATKHPLIYLVTRQIKDRDGRSIAEIGPLSEDMDGHIIAQTSQDMSFNAAFLRMILGKLVTDNHISPDNLLNYVFQSPVYNQERRRMLEIGIRAYFLGDFVVAAHILIPQIEQALRNLLRLVGGSVYRRARNGGLLLRNLDEILRDEFVVTSIGEDICHYLRVLLTDQRGWNLRNDVCHGLIALDEFNPMKGDRLIHVLLVMAQIREQPYIKAETTSDGV